MKTLAQTLCRTKRRETDEVSFCSLAWVKLQNEDPRSNSFYKSTNNVKDNFIPILRFPIAFFQLNRQMIREHDL